jgi:Family of unknown function (DUF5343)
MPDIETEERAPYAPTEAVMRALHAVRRGVPGPYDVAKLQRAGVKPTIAPRTAQTFRMLGLTDDDDQPTPALEALRRAPDDQFKARLAEVVTAAYADILTYVNPAEDDPIKIRDAFRAYKPYAMHDRMARLFVGLCEYVGLIPEAPPIPKLTGAQSGGQQRGGRRARRATTRAVTPTRTTLRRAATPNPEPAPEFRPSPSPSSGLHPFVRGLIESLPPSGSVWPDAKRKEWLDAAAHSFNLMYEHPPQDSDVHVVTLTPSGRE